MARIANRPVGDYPLVALYGLLGLGLAIQIMSLAGETANEENTRRRRQARRRQQGNGAG
ncbi:hypothetical protein NYE69_10655 [Paenibacillus sp. FSL R5-0527]|uniref:hypothetical protein n=1 Tax=Paenibacillus sp. FSL R5-0527 TaxID=2975321 RepID=UPI0030F80D9B